MLFGTCMLQKGCFKLKVVCGCLKVLGKKTAWMLTKMGSCWHFPFHACEVKSVVSKYATGNY